MLHSAVCSVDVLYFSSSAEEESGGKKNKEIYETATFLLYKQKEGGLLPFSWHTCNKRIAPVGKCVATVSQ